MIPPIGAKVKPRRGMVACRRFSVPMSRCLSVEARSVDAQPSTAAGADRRSDRPILEGEFW
jgi:hypothetical protein